MDTDLQRLSYQARRRSWRMDEDPHYRCVICWTRTPWHEGVADELDRMFSTLVNQAIFVDKGRGRRRQCAPVTDGGLCSDCWCAINPLSLVEADAEALQQLSMAPGREAGLLGP
jgi:hypothetical protein